MFPVGVSEASLIYAFPLIRHPVVYASHQSSLASAFFPDPVRVQFALITGLLGGSWVVGLLVGFRSVFVVGYHATEPLPTTKTEPPYHAAIYFKSSRESL